MINAQDLWLYLRHHESEYSASHDEGILRITISKRGFLTVEEVSEIFKWKLQNHHAVSAVNKLVLFELESPGYLEKKTSAAYNAKSDLEALEQLRGLPQMKGKSRVAVASALLMCLDIDKYTVMDRRANESLVMLKPVIKELSFQNKDFEILNELLAQLNPPKGYMAVAADFGIYMSICRELSRLANMNLRNLDRALYSAKGNLSLLGKLK